MQWRWFDRRAFRRAIFRSNSGIEKSARTVKVAEAGALISRAGLDLMEKQMEMSEKYRQTLEEDKRERMMERELGVPPRVPEAYRLVIITDEDGQNKFVEARPVPRWWMQVFEAAALLTIIGTGLLFYAALV